MVVRTTLNYYDCVRIWLFELYLCDNPSSDGRTRVTKHEATQVFEVAKQLDADRSIQLQLHHAARVLRQAP